MELEAGKAKHQHIRSSGAYQSWFKKKKRAKQNQSINHRDYNYFFFTCVNCKPFLIFSRIMKLQELPQQLVTASAGFLKGLDDHSFGKIYTSTCGVPTMQVLVLIFLFCLVNLSSLQEAMGWEKYKTSFALAVHFP